MRSNLVERFKNLTRVTELMEFRVNGIFVQNIPNQKLKKVN